MSNLGSISRQSDQEVRPDAPEEGAGEPEGNGDSRKRPGVKYVLEAIGDGRCREIIAATSTPATVAEISEETDLPRSTVYRRVRELVEAGVLEEALRLCQDGQHSSEYAVSDALDGYEAGVGGVHVSIELEDEAYDKHLPARL